MLVTFVGNSGVGKDTIMKRIIELRGDAFIKFPTITTRKPRDYESEGDPYHFVSEEQFKKYIEAGELYEYNYIHGVAYYGGSKRILKEYLDTGKTLLKDIDVEGVRTYRGKLKNITRILSVYLYCADRETVLARLRKRGDSEESIRTRAQRFDMEDSLAHESEYMVNNEDVDTTACEIMRIIEHENEGSIYMPAKLPTEAEIAAAAAELTEDGDIVPAQLAYNGKELIITEGAARYAYAMKTGKFIQKKIAAGRADETIAAAADVEKWLKMLG